MYKCRLVGSRLALNLVIEKLVMFLFTSDRKKYHEKNYLDILETGRPGACHYIHVNVFPYIHVCVCSFVTFVFVSMLFVSVFVYMYCILFLYNCLCLPMLVLSVWLCLYCLVVSVCICLHQSACVFMCRDLSVCLYVWLL